jgi:predicted ABC-type ATPase
VPEDVIRRRFSLGLQNLKDIYQQLVDAWVVYDNSGSVPKLLEWGEKS